MQVPVFSVDAPEAGVLAMAVQEWDQHAPQGDGREDSAGLAEVAAVLSAYLPTRVLRALQRFRSQGSDSNVLLLRGLPVGGLQSTPETTEPAVLDQAARSARLTLLGTMSLIGEPFTYHDLYGGRLVQHVVPIAGREQEQTSEGSDVLEWHVEDAHSPVRCDHFGLLCLRGDPAAATRLTPARAVELPGGVAEVLRQPRFVITPDIAHTSNSHELTPVPVLTGPEDDPEICFDAIYQRPANTSDTEAAEALRALAGALEAAAMDVVLEPGDLVLVDNRRVVHARTLFQPRFDGNDRWLLRAMSCASVRAHRRRGATRAL